MLVILNFCSFPWWLSWLLPFLLGLGLGWVLWSKYKAMIGDLEGKISSLNSANTKLESNLTNVSNKKADLEGDVALMKGRVREIEAEMDKLRKSAKSGGGSSKDNSAELNSLKSEISDLQSKLSACQSNSSNLQSKLDKASADLAAAKSSGGSNLASAAAGFVAGNAGGGADLSNSLSADSGSTNGSGAGKVDPYSKLKSDNLQIVEGIGPKMESILHENGVKTWSELAAQSPDDLRNILNKYGDKYRIIDPSSWAAQAAKASSGDWDGMISLQKSLDGGKGNTGNNNTDAKVEKVMVKMGYLKRYKLDDLKAVEGIGPKIAGLLNDGGINTWRELANTDVSKIQGILDAAGSRYKLADPSTWPKQAELAADGKWDELEEYQDYLQGGKG